MSPNHSNSSDFSIQSIDANGELSNGDDEEPDSSSTDRSELSRRTSSSPGRNSLHSAPRSRPSSPLFRSGPSRFSNGWVRSSSSASPWLLGGWLMDPKTRKKAWQRRRVTVGVVVLMVCFFVINWWMILRIQESGRGARVLKYGFLKSNSSSVFIREELRKVGKGKTPHKTIHAKLLAKAAHALAEGQNKPEPKDLWEEPYMRAASSWTPCSEQRDWEPNEGNNGYIMVSANGGINQQRVAVCNAVAVARLLNATLVLPIFLYSSVWRDASQFGDIYQEEHFINYLKPDIRIVKELPKELQSLDLEAIGSVVTDADIVKEAKPSFYRKYILPILHINRVVHFIGFGNRLASDPIPFPLQRLRCRCNFHALRFASKIQETGALLIKRMRQNATRSGLLDRHLVGPFATSKSKSKPKVSRYLALHLRFEIDMVAHSLCEFGGGEEERRELEAYRQLHFPALTELKKTKKLPSPVALRSEGLCPLMPEETVLMLAALGFNRKTRIFLAGAHIYGGKSRLAVLTTLFPNLVTKENLLSSSEIEPFRNFSSQLAALDFIGCTASDVFGMTDSGSQLSSLVSGYRIYYGQGTMPTIRPNKRRLADIFLKNNTIEWKVFEQRVRKAVRQNKRVFSRPIGRSVYRYPRCKECMCNFEEEILLGKG